MKHDNHDHGEENHEAMSPFAALEELGGAVSAVGGQSGPFDAVDRGVTEDAPAEGRLQEEV